MPALGLGTWRFGESRATRAAEIASVRTALELGYRLIDTAEMYGEGGAEEVVGRALDEAVRAGDVRRDEVIVVSKVYPHNASRAGTRQACDRSRRRLGLDTIDVYLLHWRGEHPLDETVDALRHLASDGHIRRWGVSNFDVDDMEELAALGDGCAVDQVWYSLGQRDPEYALLPWLRARHAADGLQPDRPGARRPRPRARRDRVGARPDRRPGGARGRADAARRGGDPEGQQRRAPARQPGRRGGHPRRGRPRGHRASVSAPGPQVAAGHELSPFLPAESRAWWLESDFMF
jgi:hypothetical protein